MYARKLWRFWVTWLALTMALLVFASAEWSIASYLPDSLGRFAIHWWFAVFIVSVGLLVITGLALILGDSRQTWKSRCLWALGCWLLPPAFIGYWLLRVELEPGRHIA
jgi:hypothetical protein